MHREVCAVADDEQVDHINRCKLDNRRANLRAATNRQNLGNMGLLRSNTSGFRGVSWRKRRQKWEASISVDGRNIFLGHFTDKAEAARAYDDAAKRSFGEFARLNFPD
jgi:hypothetical protein